jgi:hypothetical protein
MDFFLSPPTSAAGDAAADFDVAAPTTAATMTIGNDILDIGSSRSRRQRSHHGQYNTPALAALEATMTTTAGGLGRPGQFDVPNVADVSTKYLAIGCPRLEKARF